MFGTTEVRAVVATEVVLLDLWLVTVLVTS